MLADVGLETAKVAVALDGVYSVVVVREILEGKKRKGQRTITDSLLPRKPMIVSNYQSFRNSPFISNPNRDKILPRKAIQFLREVRRFPKR